MLTREQILTAFPKDSPLFDSAVDGALRQVHNLAELERGVSGRRQIKRVLAWGLAFALLLAGAFGVAEGLRRGVFDFLISHEDVLPQATELVQQELGELRVGHTDLRVTEAVYDGQAVRLVMSVTNDTLNRPLTDAEVYGDGEMGEALASDGVTALYSFDWFTIDGTQYGMTAGSGGENVAGENNGEALIYFELLLSQDQEEPIDAPMSDFTLGLPVRTAATESEQQLFIPIKVVAANLFKDITPSAPTTLGAGENAYTVTVTRAWLSPIRSAVELRVDVPDTMDDEAAQSVISPWHTAALVDENGVEIGRSISRFHGTPTGETDELRHWMIRIEIAPQESYPHRLYVAPVEQDIADMRYAVELNGGRRNEEMDRDHRLGHNASGGQRCRGNRYAG